MKNKKPIISVIMSVYNEEKYLRDSLGSVITQTLEDFELIIVDDCSTDKTVEIIQIKSYNKQSDTIRQIWADVHR